MPEPTPHEQLVDALSALGRATRASASHWAHDAGALGRTDLAVLKCVEGHGEVRMSDLASAVQVHPSVISRQVCALEKEGLVARRSHPDDGRVGLISVTEAGTARLDETSRAFAGYLARRTAHWDPEKLALAADLIRQMSESLAASAPETTPEELTAR
ncbi:MarR family transcriptional regulator [Luteipulveratus sp. YIM 133132]|uniref:MarR family transcriptional regulator n=1 Tax=Luteipulveratus flavus TaxID=3031728 RepID=A0ABT6C4G6_9MICO|nr:MULTISPECIES: MarR family transcriptional regulator [unclassified Luteipulveratus]MDE9364082.1 MarR family transcriptional regulator [Luteipulveratus sp. YIM 133132]MDF8263586.1 MarR family transcriptional regulator [Luteipulveratus sp. YIM 133296]